MLQNEDAMSAVVLSDSSDQESDRETEMTSTQQVRQLPEIHAETAAAVASNATAEVNESAAAMAPPELPSYDLATQLPSYEEAERTKAEEAAQSTNRPANNTARTRLSPFAGMDHFGDMELGTDGMFLCTFIVSFLFNWIGLLVSLCITNTVAGRFGALSGFGLSMVKWVAIIKHQNWAGDVADTDSWLWWMLIILGFLIFFRGCMQYIRIKHQWNRLGTAVQDSAYLLF